MRIEGEARGVNLGIRRSRACCYYPRTMRRAFGAVLAGFLVGPGLGCDVDRLMVLREIPTFREVTVEEGSRILSEQDALLLQVRDTGPAPRPIPEATLVTEEEPVPDAVLEGPDTVVVVAAERTGGLRYAARLARAGILRVVVVDGGPAAWREARARSEGMKPAGG